MSVREVLGQARSSRCLDAIGKRYHLTPHQIVRASDLVRPVIMRQIDASLRTPNGATDLLRILAQPTLARIEQNPSAIVDQGERLAGDAIHRQLSRYDPDIWTTLDGIARDIGISHQSLRAMMPLLTLVLIGAIRQTTAPAFLRLLMRYRPNDTGTDPFAFAVEHADALRGRTVQPETALRWLDLVLARAQDGTDQLHADPRDRI